MTERTLAARLHAHGEPLVLEEVELPDPGPGEVQVELLYAGVNPVDRYAAAGKVAASGPLPRTLGSEAVGMVDGKAVVIHGHGVGSTRDGLWSRHAVVPAAATIAVPEGVPLQAAAAMGVAGVTAWRTTTEIADVTASDRVVVLGASGGVGSMVVSLCRHLGAHVTGHTSDEGKAAWIIERGATEVVTGDAARVAPALAAAAPSVVFDALGGDFTGVAVEALAPRGRLVLFGTSAGPEGEVPLQALYRKGLHLFGYGGLIEPEQAMAAGIAAAMEGLARHMFEVPVGAVMALEDINDALDHQAQRRILGKLVLDLRAPGSGR